MRLLAAVLVGLAAIGLGPAATAADTLPGKVWTWGQNADGQLGDGTTTHRLRPGVVEGLDDIVDLHGGREHVAALDASGQVWTWGSNAEGQLGTGATSASTRPVAVPGLTGVVAVETGHNFTVALKADGTVWTAGLNSDGQLGDGTTTLRRTPVQVTGLDDAVAIAAGRNMTYAVRAGGQLVGWGRNAEGQLGDGTTTARRSPVRVGTLEGVRRVAGGRDHGLAVLADGSTWAWGDNSYGQVGDGSLVDRTAPARVVASGVSDVAAGAHHSYAMRTDGTVASWGRNYRNALGDGTTVQRTRPVAVVGVADAVSIGAGRDTGVVTTSSGRVRVWGHNASGQLGDGTTTDRSTAVQLDGITGATKAGGGGALYQVVLVGTSAPPPPPPSNDAPEARIATPVCEELRCTFSASGSSDPDGQVVSWAWDFGAAGTASGPEATVEFPRAGDYPVRLVVTDDDGATDVAETTVTLADQPPAVEVPVRVGATTRNANTSSLTVPVPEGTSEGDRLVLVVSTNGSGAIEAGTDWRLLGETVDGVDVTSRVWQRAAPAAGAGTSVRVVLSRQLKVSATLLAFRGAAEIEAWAGLATGAATARSHVAPGVDVVSGPALVVRSWADKSSETRAWTAPAGTQPVASSYGSGGGSIASLTVQESLPAGEAPELTATSTASTSKAVSWSFVVPPEAPARP